MYSLEKSPKPRLAWIDTRNRGNFQGNPSKTISPKIPTLFSKIYPRSSYHCYRHQHGVKSPCYHHYIPAPLGKVTLEFIEKKDRKPEKTHVKPVRQRHAPNHTNCSAGIMTQILDPSVEVDLDMFLISDQQPPSPQTTQLTAPNSTRQNAHQTSMVQSTRTDSGYEEPGDSLNFSTTTSVIGSRAASSTKSPPPKCHYCWESYAEVYRQITNMQPSVAIDGPWNWHSFHDENGRVRCPKMWFVQFLKAGIDTMSR